MGRGKIEAGMILAKEREREDIMKRILFFIGILILSGHFISCPKPLTSLHVQIHGHVYDSQTKAPMVMAQVILCVPTVSGEYPGYALAQTLTDGEGYYFLEHTFKYTECTGSVKVAAGILHNVNLRSGKSVQCTETPQTIDFNL